MQNRDRVSAGRDAIKLARGRATVNRRPYFAVLFLPVARKSFGVIEEAASNTSLVVDKTSDYYPNLTPAAESRTIGTAAIIVNSAIDVASNEDQPI